MLMASQNRPLRNLAASPCGARLSRNACPGSIRSRQVRRRSGASDVEAVASGRAVPDDEAGTAAQGGFVRLAVLVAEFLAPVSAVVAKSFNLNLSPPGVTEALKRIVKP